MWLAGRYCVWDPPSLSVVSHGFVHGHFGVFPFCPLFPMVLCLGYFGIIPFCPLFPMVLFMGYFGDVSIPSMLRFLWYSGTGWTVWMEVLCRRPFGRFLFCPLLYEWDGQLGSTGLMYMGYWMSTWYLSPPWESKSHWTSIGSGGQHSLSESPFLVPTHKRPCKSVHDACSFQ